MECCNDVLGRCFLLMSACLFLCSLDMCTPGNRLEQLKGLWKLDSSVLSFQHSWDCAKNRNFYCIQELCSIVVAWERIKPLIAVNPCCRHSVLFSLCSLSCWIVLQRYWCVCMQQIQIFTFEIPMRDWIYMAFGLISIQPVSACN